MSKIAKFGCELRNVVKCEKYSIAKLQILYTSTRYTILSAFYNISQPNFAILLILVCSFPEYTFFAKIKN
jgi:hypothetical protein